MSSRKATSFAYFDNLIITKNYHSHLWIGWANDFDIPSSSSDYIGLRVGTIPLRLISLGLKTNSELTKISFFEGGGYADSAGETPIGMVCANRTAPLPSPFTNISSQAVPTDLGTSIYEVYLHGEKITGMGGEIVDYGSLIDILGSEFILAANTTYIFKIDNLSDKEANHDLLLTVCNWVGVS